MNNVKRLCPPSQEGAYPKREKELVFPSQVVAKIPEVIDIKPVGPMPDLLALGRVEGICSQHHDFVTAVCESLAKFMHSFRRPSV